MDVGGTEVVAEEELRRTLEGIGHRRTLERGGLGRAGESKNVVVFLHGSADGLFPGYQWQELRNGKRELTKNGVLCHSAIEIQSVIGCPFDCSYCPYTSFICIDLDVEGFVDRVEALATSRKSQTLFKLNNRSDTLGLEPEYGLSEALVERFAQLRDNHLLLYSKGDAVEHLAGLRHRRKTVASFTLTPEPVAQLLETRAPSPEQRLAAMRILGRAGYPLRVRLSPVVPLKGWQKAYESLLTRLFRAARPEMITMWTLSMIELPELSRIVPLDALDPQIAAAVRGAEEEMRGQKGAPFPPPVRAAMYRTLAEIAHRLSKTTHLSLCLESEETWAQTGTVLVPRDGRKFLCNCGPRATPQALAQIVRKPRTHALKQPARSSEPPPAKTG